MKPMTVFLAGRMGAGKDFIAGVLVKQLGFTRLGFADAVKWELAQQLGVSLDYIERYKADLRGDLQALGHGRRQVQSDYWIRRLDAARAQIDGPAVIADMRYPNECEYARALPALTLGVYVPESVRAQRIAERDGKAPTAEQLAHPSEREVDALDVFALISGALEPAEIVAQIPALYEDMRARRYLPRYRFGPSLDRGW